VATERPAPPSGPDEPAASRPGGAPADSPRGRLAAWALLLLTIVLWSIPPVVARHLADYFNPAEQNAFRYVFAAGFMWAYVLLFHRKGLRAPLDRRHLVAAAVMLAAYQLAWVFATYFVQATIVQFIMKLAVIAGAVLAYLFEPGEHGVVRSRRFRVAAALGLLGGAGLIFLGGDLDTGPETTRLLYAAGIALAFTGTITWPVYSLFLKRLTLRAPSMAVYARITPWTLGIFLLLLLAAGDATRFLRAPGEVQAIVALSGAVCMGFAHAIFSIPLRRLGVAVCMLGLLLQPLGVWMIANLVHALGWIEWTETLATGQWLSVIPLLAGCALTILTPAQARALGRRVGLVPVDA
jgi:drug/metabolite transporter (DMT)-like permease